MKFFSPDSPTHHSRLIEAFVDDTSVGFTEPTGSATLSNLTDSLAHIAQTWEKLLFYSGGSLNLQKCSWYALHWKWEKGRPTLTTIAPHHKDLTLTTQGQDNAPPTTIRRCEINKATRILGLYLSPDGDFSTQLQILKKKADTYAHCLRSPRLTPQDIHTFHRTTYGPSMRYVLPALAIDEEELSTEQAKVLASMLNKIQHSADRDSPRTPGNGRPCPYRSSN
jgi:hypothetical protein